MREGILQRMVTFVVMFGRLYCIPRHAILGLLHFYNRLHNFGLSATNVLCQFHGGGSNFINARFSGSCLYLNTSLLVPVFGTKELTGRSRADLAHVLRRKRHRAAGTAALVAIGATGEGVDLDCIAREPSAAVLVVSSRENRTIG